MKASYKDITRAVSLRSESAVAASNKMWRWYVFPPAALVALLMLLVKYLPSTGMTEIAQKAVQLACTAVGAAIVFAIIFTVVRKRRIRGYCHSYMLDYRNKAMANGYTVCPRCGGRLIRKTGTEWVSYLGSTDTVTYRNGREVSRRNNTQSRQETYTYYECGNSSCNIIARPDDAQGKHPPRYNDMPSTVSGAALLIFNNGAPAAARKPGAKSRSVATPSKAPKVIVTVVIILVLLFCGLRYMNYNSSEEGLYSHYELTESVSGDGAAFINEVNGRADSYEYWYLSVSKKPEGFVANLFAVNDRKASVERWTQDGNEVLNYEFDGYDMGTGLKGEYYLTTVDGKLCLIDCDRETVYPQGTEFFEKHYEALAAFTYNSVIPKLTEKLAGGEYGTNKYFNTTILKTDEINACVYDERSETRILDESGDMRMYYTASFSSENSYSMRDISLYKVAEN